jgi:hypothetical protein
LLSTVGVLLIQIEAHAAIGGKYELGGVRTPDRHCVDGWFKGEALGTVVLQFISPYIRVLVSTVGLIYGSTATEFPFGDRNTLEYTLGFPTIPISLPLRSNQTSFEMETALLLWATTAPSLEAANVALAIRAEYWTSSRIAG